jgi:NADH dehydrogenase (ubiquinone) 1 alpha subcomplex subunit 9
MVIPFRGEPYNVKHLKVTGDIGQVVPQLWDLRDPDTIYESVKHSNLVVNLCAQTADTRHFTMESVNIDGARLIAKVAREAGVERFIHVSAAGANKHSLSAWLRTKALGEEAVKDVFPAATIVRPTTMFGYDSPFLTRPAELIRHSPVFPMYKPDRLIQPVYADDVARAILEIAANDETAGKTYSLAGPEVWSQREFAEYLFEILYHKPTVLENVDKFVELYAKFFSKIHRNPRWTPEALDQQLYDNIAEQDKLGFADLGIATDELTSLRRFAINVVRMYRRSFRYDANIKDSWISPPTYKGQRAAVGVDLKRVLGKRD